MVIPPAVSRSTDFLSTRRGRPVLSSVRSSAAYVQESPAEPARAYGIMVFALGRDRIDGITGFAGYPELYPVFGLPDILE